MVPKCGAIKINENCMFMELHTYGSNSILMDNTNNIKKKAIRTAHHAHELTTMIR